MDVEQRIAQIEEEMDDIWMKARDKFFHAVACELGVCGQGKVFDMAVKTAKDPQKQQEAKMAAQAFHAERLAPWSEALDEMKRKFLALRELKRKT